MATDENVEGAKVITPCTHMDPLHLPPCRKHDMGEYTHLDTFVTKGDHALHLQSDEMDDEDDEKERDSGTKRSRNGNSDSCESVDVVAEGRRQRNHVLLEEFMNYMHSSMISREMSVFPRHVTASLSSSSLSSPVSRPSVDRGEACRRRGNYYMVEPVQMKLCAVDSMLNGAVQDALQREANAVKRRPLPHSLPQQLDVPLALRCNFCRKFDSLCSKCHRKWEETLLKRRCTVAFQSYCKLPENKRCALLFMTAAHGVGKFALMQLEFDGERCLKWRSTFFPMDGSAAKLHDAFSRAGEVYALHVAFAYDCTGVASALLSTPRSLLLKSQQRVDALMFLTQPVSPKMETVLNASEVYANHLIAERAKQVRRMEEWDKAEALYEELLERKANSEHAHSGLAKMRYDQGYVEECIRLCDSMISGETSVDWNEIRVDTIKELRGLAADRYHAYCHGISGGALKTCGCVILERVRISIRRLPFLILVNEILPFCEGGSLWNLFNCSQIPLLRNMTEKLAIMLSPHCLQQVLEQQPGFQMMSERLWQNFPDEIGTLVPPPVRPLGVSVVAMADFNMFLVRAYAAGASRRQEKMTGSSSLSLFGLGRKLSKELHQTSSGETEILISKQYRIHRSSVEESWRVKETGEWEVDLQSVKDVEAHLMKVDGEFLNT